MLDTTSGNTSFFSCEYRPGATKAHTCHSTTGKAARNAVMSRIFRGTIKGEITEVAISVAPLGKCATSGAARKSYRAPGPGKKNRIAAAMPMAMTALIRRSRSSMRCCTNGCSVPASSSSWEGVSDMVDFQGRASRPFSAQGTGCRSVEFLGTVTRHPGRARLGLGAHTTLGLVPLGNRPPLEPPVLAWVPVGGHNIRLLE